MLCRISAVFAALASAQIASLGASPAEAAQHCGDWAHWVQTGPALGAGYCKKNTTTSTITTCVHWATTTWAMVAV